MRCPGQLAVYVAPGCASELQPRHCRSWLQSVALGDVLRRACGVAHGCSEVQRGLAQLTVPSACGVLMCGGEVRS